jgi:hypothetical protein
MKKFSKILNFIIISFFLSNQLVATTFLIELGLFKGLAPTKIEEFVSISLLQLPISDKESRSKFSKQARLLKEIYNLPAVQFLQRGKILWHPKDEGGKTIWEGFNRKSIIFPRLKVKILLEGKQYVVILNPSVVSIKKNVRINIEVYKSSDKENKEKLTGLLISKDADLENNKISELLFRNEIITNWHNPVFLRFQSDGDIYFLSVTNAFILGSPVSGVKKNNIDWMNENICLKIILY